MLYLSPCLSSRQAAIRKELNEFKSSEMEVHEESRIYTRSVWHTCAHTHTRNIN